MKIKNYSLKILSMAISLMMLLSVASIPAMAADLGDAYSKTGIVDGYTTGNGLSLNDFKTLYSNAQYADIETFEDPNSGTYTPVAVKVESTGTARINFYPVTGTDDECVFEMKKTSNMIGHVDNTLETWHTFSSGNNALRITQIGYGLTFSIGEIANNPDLKPVAFGWALTAGGSAFTFSTNVTYSNGETETIETSLKQNTDTETPDQTKFIGFKAPEGTYIESIDIPHQYKNRAAIVDDVAIIFDEVAGPKAPESITVTGAETVAEPQYNASKTVQFSAVDQAGSATAVKWSVEGNGATINEESGLLTLKRTEDTSIAGTVTVVATSEIDESVKGEKTITVTETDAYFESARMSDGAVTSYTKDDFVADLDNAEHKAVMNFENSAEYTIGKSISFRTAVSGDGGTIECKLQAYKVGGTEDSTGYLYSGREGYIRLPKRNLYENIGYHAIELDLEKLTGSIKPTAVGLMLGNSGGNHNCFVRIYLNGETDAIAYSKAFSAADKSDFVGYKAPGGRYIERIELETSASSDFDDLCFIFENPEEAPIRFSTDEAATDIIGSLTDVTGDIYINVKSGVLETGEKALLAIFNENELLDVAIVNDNMQQAMASIPGGKTITAIKAFVWNFNGLVPSQNDIIINK